VTAADGQLPHLMTFATAAELGSFTGAAKVLGLTQAAVSQRIQVLERKLKKSLFDRRCGGVSLTDAGRTLYAFAQQIDNLHREAQLAITGQAPAIVGELNIAASSVPGEHFLPTLLSGFGPKFPQLHVRATVSDSLAVTHQVERGEVSLGLVGRKDEKPHLEFRCIARDRMVVVAPRGHAVFRKKQATVDQLTGYPLILREVGSGLRHCFEKSLERAGRSLSELRVSLELGSNEAIREAVLRGAGLAVLSLYSVHKELESGRLRAVPVKGVRCDRDIYVVQDRRRVLPLPARLFLDYLESNPLPALAP